MLSLVEHDFFFITSGPGLLMTGPVCIQDILCDSAKYIKTCHKTSKGDAKAHAHTSADTKVRMTTVVPCTFIQASL